MALQAAEKGLDSLDWLTHEAPPWFCRPMSIVTKEGVLLPARFRFTTPAERRSVLIVVAGSWAAMAAGIELRLEIWATLALASVPALAAVLLAEPVRADRLRLVPAALIIVACNTWLTYNWGGEVTLVELAGRCLLGSIPGLIAWMFLKPARVK